MKLALRLVWVVGAAIVQLLILNRLVTSASSRPDPAPRSDTRGTSLVSNPDSFSATGHAPETGRGHRQPRGAIALSVAVALGLLLSAVGAGVVAAEQPVECEPAGCSQMPWPGSIANHETYWEAYFGGMECTKVNETGDFTTTEDHDVIIVKAGQLNFIWQPGLADTYSTSPAVSHWFYCDGTVADQVIDPTGYIGGPCADPAFYGVFDNTASTVFVKFRLRWYNKNGLNTAVKWVPGGSKFITWQHWAKPGTKVSLWYKDPNTGIWHRLDKVLVVKGSYPACDYQPGWYN